MSPERETRHAAPAPEGSGRVRRRGQTMIFLLALVFILALVVLWNFDLHKIISVKLRSQNAGDSAALAAARWQGISLNLIGNLNVLQAVAIHDALLRGQTEFPEARALADLQARLCFVGPMTGFIACQQAAKNNGIFVNSSFSSELARHGAFVLSQYAEIYPDQPYTNTPSPPTCWDDYGNMILLAAAQGVAALPDNARFFTDYANRDHLLLNPGFYDAIASSDWCWFLFNAMNELRTYQSWRDWESLPIIRDPRPMNAEFFGLGLTRVGRLESAGWFASDGPPPDAEALLGVLEDFAGQSITDAVAQVQAEWYCYDDQRWRAWTSFIPEGFPFEGKVKKEYDYVGADSAVRIETKSNRLTPGAGEDWIMWSAAAKPFGYLPERERPSRYGLVLPAFREVRLIPVDTSTSTGGGTRPGWAEHIHEHLSPYVRGGLSELAGGCWYCNQLRTWEDSSFRQGGVTWIEQYGDQCHRSQGGGRGGSGGTRRGH